MRSLIQSRCRKFGTHHGNNILFGKIDKNPIKQVINHSHFGKQIQELSKSSAFKPFNKSCYFQNEYHLLTTVYSPSGAIADMPKWYRFGLIKISATIVAFVLIGSVISKTFVTLLEEYDIFKPEDDDDEDDD
ncbi:unnamed protein product [Brachionus calyciflorus]|uniref:Essential MCU regulator, mitochondrial n=1 Tax=Brachionus calyciflorus TaxID=104777 RepID=A0A813MSE5_9BILA|nr:unnamed protein product [Brachionus calyciflorus]